MGSDLGTDRTWTIAKCRVEYVRGPETGPVSVVEEARLRKAEAERSETYKLYREALKDNAEFAMRAERLEAELREAREALFEQWETAHFDHCTRLEDGRCPREGGPVGCMWPMPEFLRARGGLEKGDTGPVA